MVPSVRGAMTWTDEAIEIIDQTLLPGELRVLRITTPAELVDAIQRLAVRGAPALGVAGALGVLLAGDDLEACERIAAARPTAVNLRWAVARVLAAADREAEALRCWRRTWRRARRSAHMAGRSWPACPAC